MYIHTHTYIHACTHTHTHTYIHIYTHTYTHIHIFITIITFLTDYSVATCNHLVTLDTVSYVEMLLSKLLVKGTWDNRITT